MEEEMLTVNELAKRMKVSPRTVYRMLQYKQLPFAVKFGGSWRFPKEEVDKMMRRS